MRGVSRPSVGARPPATHVFKELLPAVIHALAVLPTSRDNAVVGIATAYLN